MASDDFYVKVLQSISDLNARVQKLEQDVAELKGEVSALTANSNTTMTLIKYVITPLLIIVGALVGIKLTLP